MLEKEKVMIDPRTKLLFCILINIVIYSYVEKIFLVLFILFAMGLLFYYKEYTLIKTYVILYFGIFIFRGLMPYLPQIVIQIVMPTIVSIQMFFPFIIFGALLVKTSRISDIAQVLDKIHCPNALLIPFLVLVRFFPTVAEEAKTISNAMKLRGLNFGLRSLITKPRKTIEYLYVPLLYSMVKLGNELTVAALTRGLGLDIKRTYEREVKIQRIDIVLIFIFLLLMITAFVFGKEG